MDWDAIGRFVSTVGFPAAVAIFVLVRLNGKLDRVAGAMERVAVKFEGMIDRVDSASDRAHEDSGRVEDAVRRKHDE